MLSRFCLSSIMLLHTYTIFIQMWNLLFFWQTSVFQLMDQGVTADFKACYLQITYGVLIATGLHYVYKFSGPNVYPGIRNVSTSYVGECNILALPRVTKENSEYVKDKWYPERETQRLQVSSLGLFCYRPALVPILRLQSLISRAHYLRFSFTESSQLQVCLIVYHPLVYGMLASQLLHSTKVSQAFQPSCFNHLHCFWIITQFISLGLNLDLHIPLSFPGPQILLSILVSKVRSIFSFFCEGPTFTSKGEHRPYNKDHIQRMRAPLKKPPRHPSQQGRTG